MIHAFGSAAFLSVSVFAIIGTVVAAPVGFERSGATLVVANTSVEAGRGLYGQVLLYNTATNSVKTVNATVSSDFTFVSSAVVCGDTYITVWSNAPFAAGLMMTNLATGAQNSFQSFPGVALYHSLACDPHRAQSVIALGSVPGQNGATFALYTVNIINGTATQVGDSIPKSAAPFFAGWDSSFTFSNDGTKGYFGFADPNGDNTPVTGTIAVVETKSGSVTGSFRLDTFDGAPYSILPPASGDTTLHGAVALQLSDGPKVTWVSFDLEGSTASVTKHADASKLWNAGVPSAVCDGVVYTTGNPGDLDDDDIPDTQAMFLSDPTTGAILDTVPMYKTILRPDVGGIACFPTH